MDLPIACPGLGYAYDINIHACGVRYCWREQHAGTSWCKQHLEELRG